ncbi:MAG: dipicolinate synthase subunit DpsA [Firmicutes bacterium]|nr:dipicolinate synthase subunit DpsA [Bacillota bacterium]
MKLANVPITMLGGDLRELELAKTLLDYEVDLRLVGFPPMSVISRAKHFADAVEAVRGAKFVLGPMSNTDMDGWIFNRLDQLDPIDLVEVIKHLPKETYLLIGVAKPIIVEMASKHQIKIIETAEIDDIAILNSIPTAEGAIQLAMEELPITIHSSKCLVVGYGRCGMTLARSLAALGAKVTVASRKAADIARIIEMGYTPLPLADLYSQVDFDVIFNTVPALVLTKQYLKKLSRSVLIIDIAASPGGVDYNTANDLGIKAILALSLPGKVAPITAGQILSDCIPRLLIELLGGDQGAS